MSGEHCTCVGGGVWRPLWEDGVTEMYPYVKLFERMKQSQFMIIIKNSIIKTILIQTE